LVALRELALKKGSALLTKLIFTTMEPTAGRKSYPRAGDLVCRERDPDTRPLKGVPAIDARQAISRTSHAIDL
jgi:hypothetical protein